MEIVREGDSEIWVFLRVKMAIEGVFWSLEFDEGGAYFMLATGL